MPLGLPPGGADSGAAGPQAAAHAALRALARSSDGVTALHAIEALGRAGEESDEGLLVEAVDREDAEVAKAAARALGNLSGPASLEALARALAHPRWDVRRAAAQGLGQRGGAPSHALLRARDAVEDDGLVREAIAEALHRA
jgi:HEAT repeat protein